MKAALQHGISMILQAPKVTRLTFSQLCVGSHSGFVLETKSSLSFWKFPKWTQNTEFASTLQVWHVNTNVTSLVGFVDAYILKCIFGEVYMGVCIWICMCLILCVCVCVCVHVCVFISVWGVSVSSRPYRDQAACCARLIRSCRPCGPTSATSKHSGKTGAASSCKTIWLQWQVRTNYHRHTQAKGLEPFTDWQV